MNTIEKEKIAKFISCSDEIFKNKTYHDYLKNTLTVGLIGYIYTASKEQGEFTVYVPRPSFLDWLLRRTKTITVPYTIRQLMKTEDIPETLKTIEIEP